MPTKYDQPPAYAGSYPQQPQAAYAGPGYEGPYAQQGYQQGPPGGYYQPGPQMGYYPQQPGYGPGPYQQGYYDQRRGNPGCLEGLLAATACCCCLDFCLF